HISKHELYARHLSKGSRSNPQFSRLSALHRLLPPTHRRPDRPSEGIPPPTEAKDETRRDAMDRRHLCDPAGAREEDAPGRLDWRHAGGSGLWPDFDPHFLGDLGRLGGLPLPDLLRLLRLYRHRHRVGTALWLLSTGKFQSPLSS